MTPLPCCDASELLKARPQVRPQARPQDSSISATGDTGDTGAASKCQARSAVLVVLDQVMDPHNLGSIARAAVALGAMGLVLPSQRTAPLSVVASRASAGGLEVLPLARVVNLARFLQQARQQGWWNVAATVEGGQAPAVIYPPGAEPTAWLLVLGGEEKGIRPLVQAQCDYLCTIANPGQICLNVAQAATILIEHFCRQTHFSSFETNERGRRG